ncbi:putative membrane protein YqgA involved in biofilm formation [Peptoniphilus olsenii]|uniref:Membrane protein YqgA involved in biofilm formation n=2 Tax=Peptoniphilus olsenii TaxID=411570 RepID=A0ABV2J8J6_9FIRM
MIIAIGLNILEITDIKLANALPALLIPLIVGIFKILIIV